MSKIVHLCSAVIALSLVGCGGSSDPKAKAWIDQMLATDASIETVQAKGVLRIPEPRSVADENSPISFTFEYRASGEDEWMVSDTAGGPKEVLARVDGTTKASYYHDDGTFDTHYPDHSVISLIGETTPSVPIPTRMPILIDSILRIASEGNVTATDDTREIDGSTCTMYEVVMDKHGIVRTFHVYADESIGGIPRLIEEIDDKDGKISRKIAFENYQEFSQGVFLPARYRLRSYNPVDKKKWRENLVLVDEWIVNEDLPPGSFEVPTN